MFVNAIGVLIPGYQNDHDLSEKIWSQKKFTQTEELDIDHALNNRQFRRMDRFSVLSILGVKQLVDHGCRNRELDEHEVATIINTSYGPLETNVEFVTSINKSEQGTVSPIVFSHTVNNAALGHICKLNQWKGPSTLLVSSNSLLVANSILEQDKAKEVVVVGVDQYSKNLAQYFKKLNVNLTESVAVLSLSNSRNEATYCNLIGSGEGNLGGHYYYGEMNLDYENIYEVMNSAIRRSDIKNDQIMYALISTSNLKMKEQEEKYLRSINPDIIIINLYDLIGESLGATLVLEALIAGLEYRENNFSDKGYCLINSFDMSGNYISYIIGK